MNEVKNVVVRVDGRTFMLGVDIEEENLESFYRRTRQSPGDRSLAQPFKSELRFNSNGSQ
jgi:hypothetical protein